MYFREVLANGVRIVGEEIPTAPSVAVGIWVRVGSRNEDKENHGVTHFLEHLFFKRTIKRSARQIAEELEAVGGILNAFTTKEYTCLYAKVLPEYFDLAVDLLTDIFFHSLFEEEDIEKEKGVVVEEIKMYEDSPDELIHDLFARTMWDGHPLGRTILGTVSSVQNLKRKGLLSYYQTHYVAANTVVSVAGKIKAKEVLDKLTPIFLRLPAQEVKKDYDPPTPRASVFLDLKDTEQVQVCLGTPGLAQEDKEIHALQVLTNILGGGLSSRLFQKIREEKGLTYAIYAYHATYSNSGLFVVSAGASPDHLAQIITLILRELAEIKHKGITPKELHRTKEQLRGNLLLTMESIGNRMSRLGRTEVCYGRVVPVEETVSKITLVKPEEVQTVASNLFQAKNFSLTTIGPLKEKIDFQALLDEAGFD